MEKNNRTGKRLRLIPLILGGYGAFLGFGLSVIGLAEIKEGIGIVRLLIGLGMAGFGLLGIWDGVRDLIRPDKKLGQAPARQFILTDTSGNRSSLVTPEILQEQMGILAESEDPKRFDIQILPPLSVGERGLLKQILSIYHGNVILVAFFEISNGGHEIYQKSTKPDMALEWLKQLLIDSPDFSGWENIEAKARQENVEAYWHQLLNDQKGQMIYWHQLLVIFGESWHDEHKFFSARDVELAIEGIQEEKYTKVFLEWGTNAFDLFPGVQNDLMVIWHTNSAGRFLAKEGTVTQVKFWLVNYLDHGFFEEMSGWTDITAQIEKAQRKDGKKHGKIF